jgi:hypothetical protein
MADIVIAVGRNVDDILSNLYTGYDFSAGKVAWSRRKPHIGWVFRGDPSTAAHTTLRTSADNPPITQAPSMTDISPEFGHRRFL